MSEIQISLPDLGEGDAELQPVQLNLPIPGVLHRRIRVGAAETGMMIRDFVVGVLERGLDEYDNEKLIDDTAPYGGTSFVAQRGS